MRGQRFSTAEEALNAFNWLIEMVQTHVKVYTILMGNILKNNKAIFDN